MSPLAESAAPAWLPIPTEPTPLCQLGSKERPLLLCAVSEPLITKTAVALVWLLLIVMEDVKVHGAVMVEVAEAVKPAETASQVRFPAPSVVKTSLAVCPARGHR